MYIQNERRIKVRLDISCSKEFKDFLEKLKEKTRINKSEIVRLAVIEWAKKRGKDD